MSIKVVCKCGRTLNAPDDSAGKNGTCPSCGSRLTIGLPEADVLLTEVPADYATAHTIDLGIVKTRMAQLKFSFQIDKQQNAFVETIATSNIGRRTEFVMARVDDASYEALLKAIGSVRDVVTRYRDSGPSRRLTEAYVAD
jgi:hypothetical protein